MKSHLPSPSPHHIWQLKSDRTVIREKKGGSWIASGAGGITKRTSVIFQSLLEKMISGGLTSDDAMAGLVDGVELSNCSRSFEILLRCGNGTEGSNLGDLLHEHVVNANEV